MASSRLTLLSRHLLLVSPTESQQEGNFNTKEEDKNAAAPGCPFLHQQVTAADAKAKVVQQEGENSPLPGPWCDGTEHPRFGSSVQFRDHIIGGTFPHFTEELVEKYGHFFKVRVYDVGEGKTHERVLIQDPATVRRILKRHVGKPRQYISPLLGAAILSVNDPKEWQWQRSMLRPAFTNQSLRNLFPTVRSSTSRMVELLDKIAGTKESVEFREIIIHEAFLMIGHMALGEETEFLNERGRALREAFDMVSIGSFLDIKPENNSEMQAAMKTLDQFCEEVFARAENSTLKSNKNSRCPQAHATAGHAKASSIESSKDSKEQVTSLISIINARDATGNYIMSDKLRHDTLITFMFAGHETTANTISFIILELSRDLDVQEKLYGDIVKTKSQIFSAPDRNGDTELQYGDLFKFSYLTKVIHETMRLHPVVTTGTSRILECDEKIGTELVPKGTFVTVWHTPIHRDKKIWGPTADQFDPDRPILQESFMPFTCPPRDCLGRGIAMMEIRYVVLTLVERYRIFNINPKEKPVHLSIATAQPRDGVHIRVVRR